MRTIVKKLSVFAALLFLYLACSAFLSSSKAFALNGAGSIGDPYQIDTCDQLIEINNALSAHYVLLNDIDCTDVILSPIGTSGFSGSFDGQGFYITGVSINLPADNSVGLFSRLTGSAIVENFTVYGSVVGDVNVGIVAGKMENNSHMSRVDSHVGVSCANNCGGLVGTMEGTSSISRSFSDALVTGEGYTFGGLVGWVNAGSGVNISDVYFRGDVIAQGSNPDNIGGIVGFANNLALTNAYSTGRVEGGLFVGGIIGAAIGSNISHTFTTADVSGVGMGPVFGDAIGSSTTDNYYYDESGLMPNDGHGSIGVTDTSEFKQNSSSPVFSTWSFSAAWVIEYQDYPALIPQHDPFMLCEQPDSTDTTISGHCLVEPRGWGIPTWQARYQKQGDSSWVDVSLSDVHQAQATVAGLIPGTWYNLQFRYTNNFGIGPWGTLQILTTGTAPASAPQSTPTVASVARTLDLPGLNSGDTSNQPDSTQSNAKTNDTKPTNATSGQPTPKAINVGFNAQILWILLTIVVSGVIGVVLYRAARVKV